MSVESYFKREDEVEAKVYDEVYGIIKKTVGDEDLKFLRYVGFIIFKPDTVARGIAGKVAAEFKKREIYVWKPKKVYLTGEKLDKLYMFVKQKYANTWWVMEKVFRLAPCIVSLCIGNPKDFPHLPGRIRFEIGPTTPAAGKPGKIRYDFSGSNRIFNVVHATDDPAACVREALIFYTKGEMKQAIKDAKSYALGGKTPQYEVKDETDKTCIDIFKIIAVFKRRICNELGNYNEYRDSTSLFIDLLEQEERVIHETTEIRRRREELSPIYKREYELSIKMKEELEKNIRRYARKPGEYVLKIKVGSLIGKLESLITALKILSSEREMAKIDMDRLLLEMMSFGIVKGGWEETLLHTTWAVMPQMIKDMKEAKTIVL